MKIEEMAEKPREKALLNGVDKLTDTELLSLLIEAGTKEASAYELAMRILSLCGSINNLHKVSMADLIQFKGIKKARAIKILSCIELAKRMQTKEDYTTIIKGAREAYFYLENKLKHETQEHFIALYLDVKHRIIRERVIFLGSVSQSLVHPREVFKEAIHMSACSILVAHNHPSGDPTPSAADIEITQALGKTGEIMQIPILDHIIIGNQSYYSFREAGYLD